jgi:hypothetical protein
MTRRPKCPTPRKRSYPTHDAAHHALNAWLAKRYASTAPLVTVMRAYRCQCGLFHIGSTKGLYWDAIMAPVVPLSKRS